MKTKTKKKTFDCVEMKRQAAARLREILADTSLEERVAFWSQRTRALQEKQASSRK